ncbi:MAG: class I SAM-dependent methyltransferase [Candidatus Baldrarchaeia archaeon]
MLTDWQIKRATKIKQRLFKFQVSRRSARDEFITTVNAYLRPDYHVLHAGCGGDASLCLRGRCKEVVGVDISTSVLSNPDVDRAIIADLEKLELPCVFDLVVCKGVVEHLKNPMACFNSFSKVVKKGGFVIILTPNIAHYAALITKITPHSFHQWYLKKILGEDPSAAFPTYYRANRRRKLCAMMERAGFEPIELKMIGTTPIYLSFSYVSLLIGITYEKITSYLDFLSEFRFWILGVFQKRFECRMTSLG